KSRIVVPIALHLVGQPLEIEVERRIGVGHSSRLLDIPADLWIRGISEEKLLNHHYARWCFRSKELLLEDSCMSAFLLDDLRLHPLDFLQKPFSHMGEPSISKLCSKDEGPDIIFPGILEGLIARIKGLVIIALARSF